MAHNLVLTPVDRTPSLYETVSAQLLTAIFDAKLPPGSKLPSERELCQQFGVSRTVIREAIRHLSAKGVLEVLSGSGVHVTDVGHEGISESIGLYLRQRGPRDPVRIYDVRETVELKTVELAALRADDEQLSLITETCERMAGLLNDLERCSDADVAFHRAIAEATGNELFLVLVDSLGDVMLHIRRATLVDPRRGAVALAAHRRIAKALVSKDAATAVQEMKEHLSDSLIAYQRVTDSTERA